MYLTSSVVASSTILLFLYIYLFDLFCEPTVMNSDRSRSVKNTYSKSQGWHLGEHSSECHKGQSINCLASTVKAILLENWVKFLFWMPVMLFTLSKLLLHDYNVYFLGWNTVHNNNTINHTCPSLQKQRSFNWKQEQCVIKQICQHDDNNSHCIGKMSKALII